MPDIQYFGTDVLIEKRFAPVKPVQRYSANRQLMLNKSGKAKTFNVPNRDADGNPIWAWVVYQKATVVGGVHPFSGEQTTLPFVWMPVDEANTYDEACAKAQQLSGG